MLMPDPANALLAEACCRGHGARAPVSSVASLFLSRHPDHFLNPLRRDRSRSSRARRFLFQNGDAAVEIPVAPSRGVLGHDFQLRGDLPVLHSGSSQQQYPRTVRRCALESFAPAPSSRGLLADQVKEQRDGRRALAGC